MKTLLITLTLCFMPSVAIADEASTLLANLNAQTQVLRERVNSGQLNQVCWRLWSAREYEIKTAVRHYRASKIDTAEMHLDNGSAIMDIFERKMKAGQCAKHY